MAQCLGRQCGVLVITPVVQHYITAIVRECFYIGETDTARSARYKSSSARKT